MPKIKSLHRIEYRIRSWFSKRPIFYGVIGGIGVVFFWRGVWHTADALAVYISIMAKGRPTTDFIFPWDGPISAFIGAALLLTTGLFVSTFLGNEIAISGLRGERQLAEKTEFEVRTETGAIHEIRAEIRKIRERLETMEKKMGAKNETLP